jgi:hypothetical protein
MKVSASEANSVSRQVDGIVDTAHARFLELMQENRVDDAIALADELYEWLADIESEELLFFNENELFSDED